MSGIVPEALHAVIDWIIVQQVFTPLSLETVHFPHPILLSSVIYLVNGIWMEMMMVQLQVEAFGVIA